MTDTAPSDRGETLISMEELALAARNHGMPLEALRYDITPLGLHYLLIHFDIPDADETTWRLEVGGRVGRPLSLTMEELRRRPQVTAPVTLECAGNGRARMVPRPVSQPWLEEAVGTAEWTGTPLAPLLEEAGVGPGAVEVVFTGADRGVQAGLEHDYERSLTLDEAMREEVLLAWGVNGRPAAPARLPAAAGRARLVRHDLGQVAAPDHRGRRAVRRLPADRHLQAPHLRGGPGHPGDPGSSRGRCCSPRASPSSSPAGGSCRPAATGSPAGPGPAWPRWPGSRSAPTAAPPGPRPGWTRSRPPGRGPAGPSSGTPPPAATSCAPGSPTPPATPSPPTPPGTPAATPTTPSSGSRSPSRNGTRVTRPRGGPTPAAAGDRARQPPGILRAHRWLLLASVALIWGSSFLFIDVGLEALQPGVIAVARVALGVAALALVPAARRPISRGTARGSPSSGSSGPACRCCCSRSPSSGSTHRWPAC